MVLGNYKSGNVTIVQTLCILYQESIAEATVVSLLNQGVCTDVLYPHPCLNFLLLFLSREKVKEIFIIKETKKTTCKGSTALFLRRSYRFRVHLKCTLVLLNNLATRIFES
jgi:hypothetical protein